MQNSTTVLESQLDWLTASFHTRDSADRARADADRWARSEVADGAQVKPFRLGGYEGWQAGRVRLGTRLDGALLQLSGDFAERHIADVAPRATNISRVDIAVTVRLEPAREDLARDHYDEAREHRKLRPSSARPELHQDADGGSTLYLGDRASNWFLRVYNKHAECLENRDFEGAAHYEGCWRYELEVKGPDALRQAQLYPGILDRPGYCQAYVHQWAENHGVPPVFPYTGDQKIEPGFRRRSDRETRLLWLAQSVKPAVQWLRDSTDRETLVDLLGLSQ
jgi:DNA relaxase NicK